MKKAITVLLAVLFCLSLCSCNATEKENPMSGASTTEKDRKIENVSISVYDISQAGLTLVITDTNEKPYTYGEWYRIEKKTNDEWVTMEAMIDNYSFDLVGLLVNKNNELTMKIDWEWLYGSLHNGEYRILKAVEDTYIAAEFSISTNP